MSEQESSKHNGAVRAPGLEAVIRKTRASSFFAGVFKDGKRHGIKI